MWWCIRRSHRAGRGGRCSPRAGARRFVQASSEAGLAVKLEKVTGRLSAGAVNAERSGADLVGHYLDPDRLPAERRWSRKHAHTQRRLCERFALPVIGEVACQDITPAHMQQAVNAAPTAGEGARTARMISALVAAGLDAGYLTSPRLARTHWQAAGRPLPALRAATAGESALWVDPAEIPAPDDIRALGQALAAGRRGELDELMANVAAYTGLRWGELAALTIPQIDPAARVITVNRKAAEIAGHLFIEPPKNRKNRKTIYPRQTPAGYPLAGKLATGLDQARAEQDDGRNPGGLLFPSPRYTLWRSSNFNRNVLKTAYRTAGWRDPHRRHPRPRPPSHPINPASPAAVHFKKPELPPVLVTRCDDQTMARRTPDQFLLTGSP